MSDGTWNYYQNGQIFNNGWKWIGNNWYYFFEDGTMAADQIVYPGQYHSINVVGHLEEYPDGYYVDKNGHCLMNQWIYEYGMWNYAKSNGRLAGQEWVKINGSWYYFEQGKGGFCLAVDSIMEDIHGNYYAFDKNGHYYTNQWVSSNVLNGDLNGGEDWVFASVNGILYGEGWHNIAGNWYYFISSKNSDIDYEGYGYYDSPRYFGVMKTGWQKVNGSWYYLQPGSGHMLTGWQWINGRWYLFNNGGDAATGWQWINNKWYYFDPTNVWMVTGQQNIGGKNYYFDQSGALI